MEAASFAAAHEHLLRCTACRGILAREEALADALRAALAGAADGLALSTMDKRRMLEIAALRPAPRPSWNQVWRWMGAPPLRPIFAGAALAGIVVAAVAIRAHRQAIAAVPHGGPDAVAAWVVDVPLQTQTRIFRQENGTVVDAILPGVAVARADFRSAVRRPVSP